MSKRGGESVSADSQGLKQAEGPLFVTAHHVLTLSRSQTVSLSHYLGLSRSHTVSLCLVLTLSHVRSRTGCVHVE